MYHSETTSLTLPSHKIVGVHLQTVDLIFGMGFGLTLTPILLLLHFEPHQIIPSLLLASLAGNILSPFFNHRLKNADFNIRSPHLKIALIVGLLGAVGSFVGAIIATKHRHSNSCDRIITAIKQDKDNVFHLV